MSEGVGAAAPAAPATPAAPAAEATAPVQSLDTPVTNGSEGEADASASVPAAPPEPPKKYKVKWGDQEGEVDESELISGYQRAKASAKKFEEAAAMRKAVEAKEQRIREFADALERDPEAVLENLLGARLDEIAEARMIRRYELQQMDPVQRQRYEMEQERAAWEAERQRWQQEQEAHRQQRVQAEAERVRPQLVEAFKGALKAVGVPQTQEYVLRMRDVAMQFLQAGQVMNAETTAQAAQIVSDDYQAHLKTLTPVARERLLKLEGEDLLKTVQEEYGQEFLEKLRKAELAKVQAQRQQPPAAPRPADRPRGPDGKFVQQSNVITTSELRKRLGIGA